MLNAARTALLGAALAALLVPGSFAQDKKSNPQSKETLWVMTYSGGGG